MKFKPFSKTFDFSNSELIEDYPPYIQGPISQWFYHLAKKNRLGYNRHNDLNPNITNLESDFISRLNVLFRQTFPSDIDDFMANVLSDSDLTSNFLALMLQNYCNSNGAKELEVILADGGSAFAVEEAPSPPESYAASTYDLVKRVPPIVADVSRDVLSTNDLIREAWHAFYSRNPNYEKTVLKCCDALEHLLRDKYEPKNIRPQLGLLLKNLERDSSKLDFKGATLLGNKFDLLRLIANATAIRGSHTAGTGRNPTPEEAEFVLHSTILIWNTHQRI